MQCDLRGSGGAVGGEGDVLRSGSFCASRRDMARTRLRFLPERFGLINPADGDIGNKVDRAIAAVRDTPGMVARVWFEWCGEAVSAQFCLDGDSTHSTPLRNRLCLSKRLQDAVRLSPRQLGNFNSLLNIFCFLFEISYSTLHSREHLL